MGVRQQAEQHDHDIALLQRALSHEIEKSREYLEAARYEGSYRPATYAVAYATAVLDHSESAETLLHAQHWISVWTVLRAEVTAMLWVHDFAVDPIQTVKDVELSSIRDKLGWKIPVHSDNLVAQEKSWIDVGAKKKARSDTSRCEDLDRWVLAFAHSNGVSDVEPNGWFTTWKMATQAAHMDGHQIANLMMHARDNGLEPIVVSGATPQPHVVELLYGEVTRCLGFALCRLGDFLSLTHVVEELDSRHHHLIPAARDNYNQLLREMKAKLLPPSPVSSG